MIQSAKRTMSVLLVLVMVLSVLAGALPQQARAATGKLQHNTGKRNETCTSLSDQALDYYTGQYSWDILSTTAGGTINCADTDDNQLYQALHTLMASTHTKSVKYTGDGGLQDYWPYTDSSADVPNSYEFFYGEGTTKMNREHVWPNSHGTFDKSGGGSDLHHLRPTNGDVNSARSSYTMGNVRGVISDYDTKSFNGKNLLYIATSGGNNGTVEVNDEFKGDVARILLYVWCRWEEPNLFQNTGSTSGSDGKKVIESLDTLLQWMELDPVDEWEMGRNDQVENVQGNRNVFIDYPELAWMVFGKEVPENLCTPSSGGSATCTHEQTAHHAAVAPTCTTDGTLEYWQCNSCRQYFSDSACKNRIYATTVSALGHDYKDGACSRCGAKQPAVSDGKYVKVTTGQTDWSGIYLIVYEKSKTESNVFSGIDMGGNHVAATISSGTITPTAELEPLQVQVAACSGGYSFKLLGGEKAGKYLKGSTSKNTIGFSDTPVALTIACANGTVTVKDGTVPFQFNSSDSIFRFYYKASQKDIALYKLNGQSASTGGDGDSGSTGGNTGGSTGEVEKGYEATRLNTLTNGSKVFIYNPASGVVNTATSYTYTNSTSGSSKDELTTTTATLNNSTGVLTVPKDGCLFTVKIGADGNVSFVTEDGKYLYMDEYNVRLVSAAGQYTIFTLETASDGYYIKSVNATHEDKPQYLEYFLEYYTVYGLDEAKAGQFIFQFYTLNQTACDHAWSKATCKTPSTCTKCGETTGSVDPSNHTGKPGAWQHDGSKHWKEYSCCAAHAEEASHSGGKATCKTAATCSVCGTSYGEKDSTNHAQQAQWKSEGASTHKQYYPCCNTWTGESRSHDWKTGNGGSKYCQTCGEGCKHTETTITGKKDATCAAEGYTGDECCKLCGKVIRAGETISKLAHSDANKDHKCDACKADVGEHKAAKGTHDCAYCGQPASTCEDANKDHKCDVCGKVLGTCEDGNRDHNCDTCGKALTECADDDKDHKCDLCGKVLTECADDDKDHKCDLCGKVLSACTDEDKDSTCDLCGRDLSECFDDDKDHKCDFCGKDMGEHKAADGSHDCAYCGQPVTECADENKDHKCDICGKDMGEHKAADGSHNCAYCGQPVTECADADKDHNCDICGKALTECVDEDGDGKCDICSGDVATVAGPTAPGGSNILLWVVLSLVALGLIVFVILFLLKKKKETQQPDARNEQ